MTSSIAVWYTDLLTGVESSETIRLRELHFFFEDEALGLIRVDEVHQSFDDWETMEVIYKAS